MLLHVIQADYLGDYKLRLKFNNGAQDIVDLELEQYGEVFEPLRDKEVFRQFTLTGRTVEWPTGADFAPEFLLQAAGLTSKRPASLYRTPTTQRVAPVATLHESPEPYETVSPETEES